MCAAAALWYSAPTCLHMSRVLTANTDALGGLQCLVVKQGAFVFPCSLSADGSQRVGVQIFYQHFMALVQKEQKHGEERGVTLASVISGNKVRKDE